MSTVDLSNPDPNPKTNSFINFDEDYSKFIVNYLVNRNLKLIALIKI